ncbi:MAG: serine hydrolase domain-containing protein [Gemmatimonadaceae bacterium]
MPAYGSRPLFALLAAVLCGTLQQPLSAQAGSADELAGLWRAQRWFGPVARGPLVVRRNGSSYTADMVGRTVPVRVERGELWFELPGDRGKFRGKLRSGEIFGFWFTPGSPTGLTRTIPITLRAKTPNQWSGDVNPPDDTFTFYLLARKRPDATMGVFLRNPDRDQGALWAVDRIAREGNAVKLISRRGEKEQDLASGAYNPDDSVLTINFPFRGVTYQFRREVGETDFYPRGRNPVPYSYGGAPLARDDGWPTATLDQVDIDRAAIEKMVQRIFDTPMETVHNQQIDGVLLARHGKLVLEEYFHGHHRDRMHDTRSASKSMTATLVGAAMYAGAPLSLSTPVYPIMNGGVFPVGLDPMKRQMTLEHLLSMSSGFYCDDSDPKAPGREDTMWDQDAEPNFYQYALRLPMAYRPGEKAVYCSTNPNLALGVLQQATGEPPLYTFDRLVADPLRIHTYGAGTDPSGNAYGGGGWLFLPRDFMKFGQLMLNQGMWNGRRILSRDFVARASSPIGKIGTRPYGLAWWIYDLPYKDRTLRAFAALGNGGQNVFVVPELDLVVAVYASNYGDRVLFEIQNELVPKQILPAVKEAGRKEGREKGDGGSN